MRQEVGAVVCPVLGNSGVCHRLVTPVGKFAVMIGLRLLLVEDDISLAKLLEYRFANEGYLVRSTPDGDEALRMVDEEPPDLVILDWAIRGTNGIDVLRQLRLDRPAMHMPVIMLTARNAEHDRIRGLEVGADDYLTKPFSPRELLARVAAVLRRVRPGFAGETIQVGDLRLDRRAHRVERAGKELKLAPREYQLLAFLMENPRKVFSRTELLDAVWGDGGKFTGRTVDVHIRRLRRIIGAESAFDPIRTVRSAGYVLAPA